MTEEEKKEKARHRARAYYEKNKERIKQRTAKWGNENKERRNEIQRKCHAKHAVSRAAAIKKWWDEHPEKRAEYALRVDKERDRKRAADYRKNNPEKRSQVSSEYYERNKEKIREWGRAYSKANPDLAIAKQARRRARIMGVGGELSKDIKARLFSEQGGKCAYCFVSLNGMSPHLDHFMPLVLGGTNDDSNVVLTCPTCNTKKNAKNPFDFMRSMGLMP